MKTRTNADKPNNNIMSKSILPVSCLFLSLLGQTQNLPAQQWWDNNGASAATSGNWDTTTTNWANSSALTASTVPFTSGSFAIFAAGSTAISSLTVTVPGAVTCDGFGDATTSTGTASGAAIATLMFSGAGSINLPAGTWSIECGNSSPAPNIYVNVPITGSGGFIQHNSGSLYLDAANTYSGGTTITGGQLTLISNNAAFGTGPITFTGTQSIENVASGILTLTNAWIMNNGAGGLINFAGGNVTCTGPWTLLTSEQIKDNSTSNPLTISGAISGAGFGIGLQNADATAVGSGTITLSGPNTYTGQTFIGAGVVGGITTVSVTSINSVANPPQQSSSSLGVPSSAANGTIAMGATTYGCALIYTGPGETSDRVISLVGTTNSAITIAMNGTGPLVLTSSFTAPTNGAKTLTLEGTSTANNTIAGAIPNPGSGATSLTKAQAGTWVLSGTNTFSGNTTISAGTLTIGGAGRLNSGSYAGTIANSGTFIYASSDTQTLSGVISGAGTLTDSGSGELTLSGANTYTGVTTLNAGSVQLDKAETVGTSGPLGKSAASNPGSIVLNGGFLQYVSANGANDYSGRFSTANNQAYNIDVNGQSVTFATALSSSGGELTVESTTAGGTLTLNAAATYSGATTITSGTLTIGSSGSLGGGTYAASITDNGTFNYAGSAAQTLSGTVSGTGALTESGPGSLTLTAADTYAGATTIGAGSTLYLTGSGSINSSTSMSIAAGGTFDVSALASPYNLNTTSLTVTGTSTAAATINGAAGGIVNLGAQPVSLTFSPTSSTGDNAHPALVIPQSLTLSGNVITVNNASGTPLGAGNYTLIQAGSGTTGTPSQYVAVTGSGIAAGDFATVQVIGGNVVLVVTQPANTNPTWLGNDYANHQTWSDSLNWSGGVPDATGDQVIFANGSSQTPVMDSSYTVYSLAFYGASDILANSGGSVLTVGSGVTNNSGNPQTLALPVRLVDLGGPSVPSQWNTSSGSITASGVISDNNIGLTVSGGNTLTLSGLNTYTGPTTINGGTVSANTVADAACSIGTGALTIEGGATVAFTGTSGTTARTVSVEGSTTDTINVPSGSSLTLNGQVHSVSDTAAQMLTLTGGGTLNLGGTLDNSGLTMAVNQGELVITKSSASTAHGLGGGTSTVGTGTAGNSAELQLAGSGSYDLYSTCVLTVNSPDGFVDLNGQSDSFSTLTLSGAGPNGNGVLINSATNTTSSITNGGSAVVLAGPTTIGGSGNIKLASAVSGSGMSLTYDGTGTLTLAAAGTYSGGTTVNAGGTLQLNAGGVTNSSAGTGPITLNGDAALNLSLTSTEMNNVINGGSTSLITISMGSGNLWLSNSAASQLNNFSGTLNVSSTSPTGGQLVVGSSTDIETINSGATWQIQSGVVVDFNVNQTDPATVYLYGAPYTGAADGSLRLDDSVQSGPVILEGNSQIGNGSSSGASTVSGIISDGGKGYGFTKTGANPVILSAANTYTGSTIVSAGLLDINSSGSVMGNVTVNAGTLEMDNNTAMASTATLTVAAAATVNLNYGANQNINALYVAGVQQAPGVYGANAYNPGNVFTGPGTVTVSSGPVVKINPPTINGNNQLVISWNSVAGANYNVYTTTNLAAPITWTLVNSSPITSQGTSTSFTLPGNISTLPQLFVTVQQ